MLLSRRPRTIGTVILIKYQSNEYVSVKTKNIQTIKVQSPMYDVFYLLLLREKTNTRFSLLVYDVTVSILVHH